MPHSHGTRENVKILLQALRDPSNSELRPQIKRALGLAGYSEAEITYYERTGKEMKDNLEDFDQEMEEFRRETAGEFESMRRKAEEMGDFVLRAGRHRSRAAFYFGCAIFSLLIAVTSILLLSDRSETDATSPPAVTETAPKTIQDGDKL